MLPSPKMSSSRQTEAFSCSPYLWFVRHDGVYDSQSATPSPTKAKLVRILWQQVFIKAETGAYIVCGLLL
jgi:hypothetical protein